MPIHSPLFPSHTWRTTARITSAVVAIALFSACAPDKPDPTGLNSRTSAVASNGVPFAVGLASPAWQQTTADLVSQALLGPTVAAHVYPLVGVAQYLAVQKAEAAIGGAGGRRLLEADRGAVAGASAVVLTYLFPASRQALEDLVTAQANAGPGQPHPAFSAGEAIGRAVGDEIVTRARGDGFTNPNTAVPPVGDGYWTSSANPPQIVAGGQLPGVTPWFLTSAHQFAPAAPPAFGSAAFNAALAEIRNLSDTRAAHPEYTAIATYWALNAGTPTTAGFWVGIATNEINARGLTEREATHLYALTSAAIFDAQIGCWESKLTWWLIRPWRADDQITVVAAVGKPNHPSYPSGHSCLSSAAGEVLSEFFPDKASQFSAMVAEAGLSRMYAGIHYRFDIEAGQQLGRSVARYAIAQDAAGTSVLNPH